MSKEKQAKTLQHWFSIDRILFGNKHPKNVLESEERFLEYESLKGAFLTNLFDIYLKTGYSPNTKFAKVNEMAQHAIYEADFCSKSAYELLENEDVKALILEEIEELKNSIGLNESEEIARTVLRKRHHAAAIDMLTIVAPLKEGCVTCISDWTGTVYVDAYKTLRDKLIEFAI